MNNQNEVEKIPLTIASKRIKYLAINLMKELQNLHDESYKTLSEDIKEDLSKWNNARCLHSEHVNMVYM